MSLIIKKCKVMDFFEMAHFPAIMDEYANECGIKGLPHPLAKIDLYKLLEENNSLQTIGAFLDDYLVGFIIILAPILTHYSVRVAVTESFFVMKEHRKTGAGLKLEQAARDYAKEQNACGLLISAPTGGTLVELLPRLGYVESNRVFFKAIPNE